MKLFTVGPVQMHKETLAVGGEQLPYFRTSDFSDIMFENERILKSFLDAPADAKTIFLTASGTGAMEAAVINCLNDTDKVLIINGGGFGKRFCEICDIHGIAHDDIELKWDEALTKAHLEPLSQGEYSALLVNAHETSTGQLYDLKMLSAFCKKKDMFFIVDAISSFGADELSMSELGIDACIISSQKAMALSPGISVVVISPRMYEERILTGAVKTLYWDFKSYIDNLTRGQTPFTPAVGILLELNESLKRMEAAGIEGMRKNTVELARYFRKELSKAGFDICGYPLSNALTPVTV